jgi:hypothetical protein
MCVTKKHEKLCEGFFFKIRKKGKKCKTSFLACVSIQQQTPEIETKKTETERASVMCLQALCSQSSEKSFKIVKHQYNGFLWIQILSY